ncbi:sialic acid-binding Ig-like lectin 14 [Gastrophryne carolinensis]
MYYNGLLISEAGTYFCYFTDYRSDLRMEFDIRIYLVFTVLFQVWTDSQSQKIQSGYSIQVEPSVVIQEGQCATIPCHFIANNKDKYINSHGYWMSGIETIVASRDDSSTKPNFYLKGDSDIGDCTLMITKARREDSGTYFFRFEENKETINKYNYKDNKLTVQVKELTQKPDIIVYGDMVANKEVTMTCFLPGSCMESEPVITWWKDTSDGVVRNMSMTITPSLADHLTSITCEWAFPYIGSSSRRTIVLDVQYRTLEQWRKVKWSDECRFTLFQNDWQIRIRREVAEVKHLSCLVLNVKGTVKKQIYRDKSGVSKDSQHSRIFSIQVSGLFPKACAHCAILCLNKDPPEININTVIDSSGKAFKNHTVSVDGGDSVTLKCSVDSNPPADVTWTKGEKTVVRSVTGQGLELSITDVMARDTGIYSCSAWNKHGDTSDFVDIHVESSRNIDYIILGGIVAGNILILSLIALGLFCFVKRNMNRRQRGIISDGQELSSKGSASAYKGFNN